MMHPRVRSDARGRIAPSAHRMRAPYRGERRDHHRTDSPDARDADAPWHAPAPTYLKSAIYDPADARYRYWAVLSADQQRRWYDAARLAGLAAPERQPESGLPPAAQPRLPFSRLIRGIAEAQSRFCESRLRVPCFL